ncbi:phospholipid transfer protein-like [Anabas testudineus]|uniref:phospholipid transfer protein-like n=1 Tax=Anabas testudineus TaxID=64144 RepID=UPI000E463D77|nr:phospholipid transfer protein-like [Anabas testudineus]
MTSCSFFLFCLVSLFSSITAVDPTGLKIRITDRALDVVKDFGLKVLEQLVNKPFPDFSVLCGCQTCKIRGFTLTNLTVDPDQVVLGFQENSGLQLEIRDLFFTGKLEQDISVYLFEEFTDTGTVTFEGKDVSATIGLKLNQNQREHLSVEIPNCEVRAEFNATASGRIVGPVWDSLRLLINDFLNTKLCSTVQTTVVPIINYMLEDVTMQLHKVLNISFLNRIIPDINVDLSLSEPLSVSPCSLDVPLRGLVWQGDSKDIRDVTTGAVPVFSEIKMMAYVGISEFFFNSAAMSVYRLGPFQLNVPEKSMKSFLRSCRWFVSGLKGPVEVNLTEAPTVSISQSGLSVDVKVRAQSLKEPTEPSVAATCQLYLKINLKGNRLALVVKNTKCNVQPDTLKGSIVKPIINYFINCKTRGFLKSENQHTDSHQCENLIFCEPQGWLDEGVPIPLPEGLHFTRGKIIYHKGFVVVGGNLDFGFGS